MPPRPLLLILLIAATAAGCVKRSGVAAEDNSALLETRGVDEPTLFVAARFIDEGEPGEAFDELVTWFDDEQTVVNPDRDVALYLAANALIAEGQRVKAFYYLEELLDTYRGSDLYVPAVRRQYEIADSFLSGVNDTVLFLPERNHNEAVEMLFRIQLRVPGGRLAEDALVRTADFYFEQGDYDFAEDAYTVFLERFPRSPNVPKVLIQQARSNALQYRGDSYDPTPLIDARQQFRSFAAGYPQLAKQNAVQETLDWIERELAGKLENQAGYYERVSNPEAAYEVRLQLVDRYPETEEAKRAAVILAQGRPQTRNPQQLLEPAESDLDLVGEFSNERPVNAVPLGEGEQE